MDCRVTLFLAMTEPWGRAFPRIVIASLKGVAILGPNP
jgi:hypothetical protein